MNGDPFGNLKEWSGALMEFRRRVDSGTIYEVQPGLARLIRYRDNWRLREEALRAARQVTMPEATLLQAVLDVALDPRTYVEARILAVQALGDMVPRRRPVGVPDDLEPDAVAGTLKRLLDVPEHPVLHAAVEQAIHRIESQASPVTA